MHRVEICRAQLVQNHAVSSHRKCPFINYFSGLCVICCTSKDEGGCKKNSQTTTQLNGNVHVLIYHHTLNSVWEP